MVSTSRRNIFKMALTSAAAVPFVAKAGAAPCASYKPQWARSAENQRKADLGNGAYLNPIVAHWGL